MAGNVYSTGECLAGSNSAPYCYKHRDIKTWMLFELTLEMACREISSCLRVQKFFCEEVIPHHFMRSAISVVQVINGT